MEDQLPPLPEGGEILPSERASLRDEKAGFSITLESARFSSLDLLDYIMAIREKNFKAIIKDKKINYVA